MRNRNTIILVISLSVVLFFGLTNGFAPLLAAEESSCECTACSVTGLDDEHDGDEHLVAAHEQGHDSEDQDHAEHDHEEVITDSQAGHDHEEGAIFLSPEEQDLIGIKIARVGNGTIPNSTRLTGQVHLNDDRLAHLSALSPGIVREVNKSIGARVTTGETLAWIESVGLGQAKVEYLDILAEVGCCKTLLVRAQNVNDNTLKLIAFLRSEPALNDLRNFESLEMGEYRSTLVKAYAEVVLARNVYAREKDLFNQKISSKQEYLDAENALKKTEAEYIAVMDISEFKVKQDLLEETTSAQRMDLALKGAERKLYVLGQRKDDIESLVLNVSGGQPGDVPVNDCPDPNCEECKKKAMQAEKGNKPVDFERLGWYPLRAPFDGTIIEKHITLGEKLGDDRSAFTIADLETVWVDFDVYPKDQATIMKGQECLIIAGGKGYEGNISYVSSVLDVKTRTASARVVLDNNEAGLRPGQFVTATIYGKAVECDTVVPRSAIQTVEGSQVVFVSDGEDFEMKPVILGAGNTQIVEIVSGVSAGEMVVTHGAFDLKAKIVTSTLDSHAGHGH